jgi:C1A family cysteine protease
MKYNRVSMILLLFIISILAFGQQMDETLAPQALKIQLQKLAQEIEKKHYSFTVGYNAAHRYTLMELCGLHLPKNWWSTAKDKSIKVMKPQALKAESLSLPSKWDWREHNGVTAIRDQDGCGSCWAFSTIGTFESLLKIKQDTTVDLSEQYLVSCNAWDWGCNGGFWAHDMLMNPGAVFEADFPYVASDVRCGGPYSYPFKLGGWSYVDGEDKVPTVEKIKDAIFNYGPVCAAVYVGSAFQSYTGGVFDKDESKSGGWLSCDGQKDPNHGIVLVGWDDSKSAWILRNSWGSGWGESGYMYIKYETSLVGYAAVVVF